MSNGILNGNCTGINILTASFDPASVAAATTAEQTLTLPGVKVGDVVFVNKPSATAGLGIAGARVTAADTVGITFINATASPINAAAETYTFLTLRPEQGTYTAVQA